MSCLFFYRRLTHRERKIKKDLFVRKLFVKNKLEILFFIHKEERKYLQNLVMQEKQQSGI